MARALNVAALVRQVRKELRKKARAGVARQAERFFKPGERAAILGVRAAAIQRIAGRARERLRRDADTQEVLRFAEGLLGSRWLEDKAAAIYTVAGFVGRFRGAEFPRVARWLRYVSDWATCDGLAINVLGPMVKAERSLVSRMFVWARSRNRWYRRAAAVSLIPAARRGMYTQEVFRLARRLYRDPDEMVQKGVGWMLKEASKAERPAAVAFLLRIKRNAPRLVLRYATEKLPRQQRERVLR